MSQLILYSANSKPSRLLEALAAQKSPIRWAYLGQDYPSLLRWQKDLVNSAELVNTSSLLKAVAKDLRGPFLKLIGELGHRYNSVAWWGSRLSERNVMVSQLFLDCCNLRVASQLIQETAGVMCLVVENEALLESLEATAGQGKYSVHRAQRTSQWGKKIKLHARIVKSLIGFAIRSARQYQTGSDIKLTSTSKGRVILRTWLDDTCLGENGVFRERFTPGLYDWLVERQFDVIILPVLYALKRSPRLTWRWLRNSRQNFINPYQYYRWSDYLFTLTTSWQQLRMDFSQVQLEGMSVARLFGAERDKFAFCSLEDILNYRLPKRLLKAGLQIDLFVDPYENLSQGKQLIMGFRRYLPATKLVGFQHAIPSPLLLSFFVPANEAEISPLPDRVVCSGDFFRDLLIREGLPMDRVFSGPALRYSHLLEPRIIRKAEPKGSKCVLVTLPIDVRSGLELVLKTIRTFQSERHLKIIIKPHPQSSVLGFHRQISDFTLPSHFTLIDGEMREWLGRADLVLAMDSSTGYEALALGIPVIMVGHETALDLNPLAWYPDLDRVFCSPEEIRFEARRLLDLSPAEVVAYQSYAKSVLKKSFGPVTDSTLGMFLNGFK